MGIILENKRISFPVYWERCFFLIFLENNNWTFPDTAIHFSAGTGYDYESRWVECSPSGWVIPTFHYYWENLEYKNLSCEACSITNIKKVLLAIPGLQFDTNMHRVSWHLTEHGKNAILCKHNMVFSEPFQFGKFLINHLKIIVSIFFS